jgi:hypothetical protein
MSTLGAVSAAWTAVEAALPLGWRTVGVMRRDQALRLLPALSDEVRPGLPTSNGTVDPFI